MEFCKFCDNMLYIKHVSSTEEDKQINDVHYFCKFCGNKEDFNIHQPKLISKVSFKSDDSIDKWIKKDIEFDLTLPHVQYIQCANKECTKESDKDNDVVLIRYDNTGVKYIYYCTYCKHYWKID